jgi:hypothetical protein
MPLGELVRVAIAALLICNGAVGISRNPTVG